MFSFSFLFFTDSTSGPASLPGGLASPDHHYNHHHRDRNQQQGDPHRGDHAHYAHLPPPQAGVYGTRDDIELRSGGGGGGGGSEMLEKDSPPSSLAAAGGPSSLNYLPTYQRGRYPPFHQQETLTTPIPSLATPIPSLATPIPPLTAHAAVSGGRGGGVHDNRLEQGIDQDIGAAANDIKAQTRDEGGQGSEGAPFDPNLVCPTCGKKFRIGQIQVFRQHAGACTNKLT